MCLPRHVRETAFVTFDHALSRDDGSLMHADRTAEAHTVPPPKIGAVNNMTVRSLEQIDQSEQCLWRRPPPIAMDFLSLRENRRPFNPPPGINNLSRHAETLHYLTQPAVTWLVTSHGGEGQPVATPLLHIWTPPAAPACTPEPRCSSAGAAVVSSAEPALPPGGHLVTLQPWKEPTAARKSRLATGREHWFVATATSGVSGDGAEEERGRDAEGGRDEWLRGGGREWRG